MCTFLNCHFCCKNFQLFLQVIVKVLISLMLVWPEGCSKASTKETKLCYFAKCSSASTNLKSRIHLSNNLQQWQWISVLVKHYEVVFLLVAFFLFILFCFPYLLLKSSLWCLQTSKMHPWPLIHMAKTMYLTACLLHYL